MLLSRYEQDQRLFNANLKGRTSRADTEAYRGDLVVEEGDIADAQGRRKPPRSVVKQAVLLTTADRVAFVAGFLEKLEFLPVFADRYGGDFSADTLAVWFVENIDQPMGVACGGIVHSVIPLLEGENTVWNELLERLGLEKGDFKGQSGEDKVVTVFDAARKEFPFASAALDCEAALARTVAVKKEARVGAV